MSEIKTEITMNPDCSYTITDAHSMADIIRWLLEQCDRETILYLLKDSWKDLTEAEIDEIVDNNTTDEHGYDFWCSGEGVAKAVSAKLKEKNT